MRQARLIIEQASNGYLIKLVDSVQTTDQWVAEDEDALHEQLNKGALRALVEANKVRAERARMDVIP